MFNELKKKDMKSYDLFKVERWFDLRFDGRKKLFKGISRQEFNALVKKHYKREGAKWLHKASDFLAQCQERRKAINFFANIPYTYEGDGLDDYSMYQRPSSNGVGYVAICPGERGNNYYVDDPLLVNYLTAKYNKRSAV